MTIDLANFTPWSATAGGALIGLAASIFILVNGRIAGISGILGGLLPPKAGEISWRIAFLSGLIVAPMLYGLVVELPGIRIDSGYPIVMLAGFLVGIGTRYGSGCTSGHGICGISRLSPRSLAATLAFMIGGFITVFIVRHLLTGN